MSMLVQCLERLHVNIIRVNVTSNLFDSQTPMNIHHSQIFESNMSQLRLNVKSNKLMLRTLIEHSSLSSLCVEHVAA